MTQLSLKMTQLHADTERQEREERNLFSRGVMPLSQSHLRALYTEVVLRSGGPGSTEAREFRERLEHDAAFQTQAQVVGELFREGYLSQRINLPQPRENG